MGDTACRFCSKDSLGRSWPWSHDPLSVALDYLLIRDLRAGGEEVLVFWIAPTLLPKSETLNTPQMAAALDLINKYVIIAATHVASGTVRFEAVPVPKVEDQDGRSLTPLDPSTTPPQVVASLARLRAFYAGLLGAFGQGTSLFAYEAGSVRACGKGGLRVEVAGETYTYDTPLPGC